MRIDDRIHSASASATGYLYQCRYALLAGLRAIPDRPQLEISVEKFDDVAFEKDGEPTELIQTKHHIDRAANLSDASSDLWKTLSIWSKRVTIDLDACFRTRFTLLTTAAAPPGSAASFLGSSDRNEQEADNLLVQIATNSTNKDNAASYAAYANLPNRTRLSLLQAVTILDGSPRITDVREEIVRELYHAAVRDQIERLVERLEGWWFNVVINALSSTEPTAIPVLAIDTRVDELREDFKRDALPVDFKGSYPSAEVVTNLDGRPFVGQLRKINIGTRRVEFAIRDYYRASEQRSRWAREDLLLDGELESYEQELVEAWEPRYASMLEELTPLCSPEKRVALGQSLFKWAEQDASFSLRSVRERFLTHGSYHILSNRYTVGWHPDYKADINNEPNCERD